MVLNNKGGDKVNATKVEERNIRDIELNHCEFSCFNCEIYKSVKEANKLCEHRKARGRMANRQIAEYKKLCKTEELIE